MDIKHITFQDDNESGDDSWNDSDEDELFEGRKPTVVVDHKPQTLLLLQNQVAQLRQDNKQLRERLHGHMDRDVKQALYNSIELRGMEQFC